LSDPVAPGHGAPSERSDLYERVKVSEQSRLSSAVAAYRRPLVSHHRQPQLRVLLDRTRASRLMQTTPQSHRNRPMLWFSWSRPRLSRKTSLPWRSPSIIESRAFDIMAKGPRRRALTLPTRASQKGNPPGDHLVGHHGCRLALLASSLPTAGSRSFGCCWLEPSPAFSHRRNRNRIGTVRCYGTHRRRQDFQERPIGRGARPQSLTDVPSISWLKPRGVEGSARRTPDARKSKQFREGFRIGDAFHHSQCNLR
jgi:hypothetical protein